MAIQIRKDRKYGGAVRPWAVMGLYPICERMVGRNTGSEEKETLHEKYMRGWIQVWGDERAESASPKLKVPTREGPD